MPTETNLPRAVWTGTFRLFGVDLECSVLDNGQRVISADSIDALLNAMDANGPTTEDDCAEAHRFAAWRYGKAEAK